MNSIKGNFSDAKGRVSNAKNFKLRGWHIFFFWIRGKAGTFGSNSKQVLPSASFGPSIDLS